jgi:hypothetical protein
MPPNGVNSRFIINGIRHAFDATGDRQPVRVHSVLPIVVPSNDKIHRCRRKYDDEPVDHVPADFTEGVGICVCQKRTVLHREHKFKVTVPKWQVYGNRLGFDGDAARAYTRCSP